MNIGQLTNQQFKNEANKSLAAWKAKSDAGEIKFNMSNQFDYSRYKSAVKTLENINNADVEAIKQKLSRVPLSSMSTHDWFNQFSDFEAPELSRGWTD